MGLLLNGCWVSVGDDEKVLEIDSGLVTQQCKRA